LFIGLQAFAIVVQPACIVARYLSNYISSFYR